MLMSPQEPFIHSFALFASQDHALISGHVQASLFASRFGASNHQCLPAESCLLHMVLQLEANKLYPYLPLDGG